jgi:dTMP kinase
MKVIPNFVIFEGGDGSGTSTQLDLLRRDFARRTEAPGPAAGENPRPVLHLTAEPTGGPVGALIREALGGRRPLLPETLARLFAADRQEHLFGPGGIVERCSREELVVCDRYVPSSLVYQGVACGEELPQLLNRGFPRPGLILYFDLDPDLAAERLARRREREIFEYRDFQVEVRRRYRELLPRYAGEDVRAITIDASASPEKVAEEVWSALKELPIVRGR